MMIARDFNVIFVDILFRFLRFLTMLGLVSAKIIKSALLAQ